MENELDARFWMEDGRRMRDEKGRVRNTQFEAGNSNKAM